MFRGNTKSISDLAGLPKITYAKRREKLMRQLGPSSVVILSSAPVAHRNADVDYVYRQDSNFLYLTGFQEPDSVAVLISENDKTKFIMFNLPHDREQEIITGDRAGQDGACKIYGADFSFPITELEKKLEEFLIDRKNIYYSFKRHKHQDEILKIVLDNISKLERDIRHGFKEEWTLRNVSNAINNMRLVKSNGELKLIQRAVDASVAAHITAMQKCRPGIYEYHLQSVITSGFLENGALSKSYPDIIGRGSNSCILHYEKNDRLICEGDIVLLDAGAEHKNYASDITRSFPATGKFSLEQRAVYDIVLRAQKAGIAAVKPGSNWSIVTDVVERVLTQGLIDLKFLNGDLEELLKTKAFLPFTLHGPGHWLGLDVHDPGSYEVDHQARPFEAGMILTIEPGIYLSDKIKGIPDAWRNIGIRIEDDVLVTSTGCKVLSENLPKEIPDIEAIMAGKPPAKLPTSLKELILKNNAIREVTSPKPLALNGFFATKESKLSESHEAEKKITKRKTSTTLLASAATIGIGLTGFFLYKLLDQKAKVPNSGLRRKI